MMKRIKVIALAFLLLISTVGITYHFTICKITGLPCSVTMEKNGCCNNHNCTQQKLVVLRLNTNFIVVSHLKITNPDTKQQLSSINLLFQSFTAPGNVVHSAIAYSPPHFIFSTHSVILPSRC
jgi:hypothetical protein